MFPKLKLQFEITFETRLGYFADVIGSLDNENSK